jgi:hypothetical protein
MIMVDDSILFCGILMHFLVEVAAAMGPVNNHTQVSGVNFN